MTTDPQHRPLVRGFPAPGRQLAHAFHELHVAAEGSEEAKKRLGDSTVLPRPWDPGSCVYPSLRQELWTWLDEVVTWFNAEYAWDTTSVIPGCWPHHPHLVHEVAVLADQRRLAGMAHASDALENWHRINVPGFLDRMRARLKSQCEEHHQPWPARARHVRQTSDAAWQERQAIFRGDISAVEAERRPAQNRPQLGVVNLATGEITPI